MPTSSKKQSAKVEKKESFFKKPYARSITICALSGLLYLSSSLILGVYSNNLSVENQKIVYDIDQRKANIELLKGEIAQLQEKSRVLGMLAGQVSENPNNVFYYGSIDEKSESSESSSEIASQISEQSTSQ